MTNIGDGFKNILLAGIGVMAYTGEKGKEIIDQLVEKGEITLDQGRELNDELKHKAEDATANIRESALEAAMSMMTPEDREEFASKVAELAKAQNEADARAAEAEAAEAQNGEVEAVVEEVIDATAESVQDSVDTAAEVVEEAVDDAADALKSDES